MAWASNLENAAASTAANAAGEISHDLDTAGQGLVNLARVGATLVEGSYDYAVSHPRDVLKTAAITVGTGVAVGAVLATLPESAAVGAVVGLGGLALGAIGLTSMAVETYDEFKTCWPSLEIVWNADQHSQETVDLAKRNVKESTGASVTNDALLLPCFLVGNLAGNLGSEMALAGKGAAAATTAASGMEAESASAALETGAASEAAAASAPETAAATGEFCSIAAGAGACAPSHSPATLSGLWSLVTHNPLDDIPHPTAWMKFNNSNWFGFESNYWLEKADIENVASLPYRFAPGEAGSGAAAKESKDG